MADAPADPAANYYAGPPLSSDPQQAQPAVGERANGLPSPQPQPPQDVGEQANHTRVVGIPGYYSTRLNNGNTAASAQASVAAPPPAAAATSPAAASDMSPATAPPPAAAAEPKKEQSYIHKLLMYFTCGKNTK